MEYNLRDRAEIVTICKKVSKELKCQEIIDWFENKWKINDENKIVNREVFNKLWDAEQNR